MELKDVLRAVPGLNKRLVYYLESQGYIRPTQIQKARISRRDYSADDLRRINRFWLYYQRGFSVRSATETATRAEKSTAFAFLPVPARQRRHVLDFLRRFDRVTEAAIIYGETGDLVVRMNAADQRDAYDVLDRIFEEAGVSGVPLIWLVQQSTTVGTRAAPELATVSAEESMLAYVLIKAPPKQVGGVIEELRQFPGIVEACALYGESDAIVKIDVATQAALDDLVMNRIHSLPAVESTRTFIVVGGMHWERNTAEQGG
ncbi:MAG TPA: Lrp/AsnC ligand binding domain-containing protein [Chloroflexota bacterium]|nr:Lrp/AsnC ligand binding domain-containing protein [Chloroflexota bacterium]